MGLPSIALLGGGQLGKMLLQAAMDLDLRLACLDPDAQAPCKPYAPEFQQGSFKDFDTVYAFAKDKDLVTIEIEHVNLEALERLQAEGKKVYPQPECLRIIQDKRLQKQFFKDHGFPTADFVLIENRAEVLDHTDFLPAFNKLGKGGYDGKGVQYIGGIQDQALAFDAPGLLEKAIDFEKELAVIVARNPQGDIQAFPTVEMVFHPVQNLVEFLVSPAAISQQLEAQAQALAKELIQTMELVGVLAVEMFLDKQGKLFLNEVAPRPHNSGHHTMRANACSQYEQHLRAICGLPLGNTQAHAAAGMLNLLGAEGHEGPVHYAGLDQALAIPGVHPYIYGKSHTKPFRKMGHVSILGEDREEVLAKANQIKGLIQVLSQ